MGCNGLYGFFKWEKGRGTHGHVFVEIGLFFGNSGRICFHFISPIHPSKDKTRHISEIVSYEGINLELQEKDVELKRLQDLLEEEHCSNKARQSKLEEETKSLQNELKAKTGDKTSLEVSLKKIENRAEESQDVHEARESI
eukprot:TRINITY_DN438_c2_g1_i1.p1 TRINITY_DN438_c2_g1~~TRINITY_DN438_c2_g1_i1.p1  ORF type:complete len:141 (-),score=17.01 TRINITY_DN438_c2_g1_i1:234-656(-)